MAFLAVVSSSVDAKKTVPPGTQGSYNAEVRGSLIGNGKANISAKAVHFNLKLTDITTGATGNLNVPNIPVDNAAFIGTSTWQGNPLTIYGHIIPADNSIVKANCIMATISVTNGPHARVVATQ